MASQNGQPVHRIVFVHVYYKENVFFYLSHARMSVYHQSKFALPSTHNNSTHMHRQSTVLYYLITITVHSELCYTSSRHTLGLYLDYTG